MRPNLGHSQQLLVDQHFSDAKVSRCPISTSQANALSTLFHPIVPEFCKCTQRDRRESSRFRTGSNLALSLLCFRPHSPFSELSAGVPPSRRTAYSKNNILDPLRLQPCDPRVMQGCVASRESPFPAPRWRPDIQLEMHRRPYSSFDVTLSR